MWGRKAGTGWVNERERRARQGGTVEWRKCRCIHKWGEGMGESKIDRRGRKVRYAYGVFCTRDI